MMMSRQQRIALVFGLALVAAGCGALSIKQVLSDPGKFRNQTLTVHGTVDESVSVLGRGAYRISDGDQSLWVVTNTGALQRRSRERHGPSPGGLRPQLHQASGYAAEWRGASGRIVQGARLN